MGVFWKESRYMKWHILCRLWTVRLFFSVVKSIVYGLNVAFNAWKALYPSRKYPPHIFLSEPIYPCCLWLAIIKVNLEQLMPHRWNYVANSKKCGTGTSRRYPRFFLSWSEYPDIRTESVRWLSNCSKTDLYRTKKKKKLKSKTKKCF